MYQDPEGSANKQRQEEQLRDRADRRLAACDRVTVQNMNIFSSMYVMCGKAGRKAGKSRKNTGETPRKAESILLSAFGVSSRERSYLVTTTWALLQ